MHIRETLKDSPILSSLDEEEGGKVWYREPQTLMDVNYY